MISMHLRLIPVHLPFQTEQGLAEVPISFFKDPVVVE